MKNKFRKFLQAYTLLLLLVTAFSFTALFADAFHPTKLEVNYPKLPGIDQLTINTTLPDLLTYLFTFAIIISGLIAFGSIVYAGFLYMTSGAVPAMRAEAKKRLQNTLTGLALLFGIYLILNTINPELVQLYTPGEGPQEFTVDIRSPEPINVESTPLDIESLKYGGVVVFAGTNTSGLDDARSETIVHEIKSFANASFLDANTGDPAITSLKILGNCTVQLWKNTDLPNGNPIIGPRLGTVAELAGTRPGDPPGDDGENNNTKQLEFIDDSCVGHSVRVYQKEKYNEPEDGGTHLFTFSYPNLNDVLFMGDLGGAGDNIEDDITSFKLSRATRLDFEVTFCDGRNYEDGCFSFNESASALNSGEDKSLNDAISSMRIETARNRQAGVTVFQHPVSHEGRSYPSGRFETFIASDQKLRDHSFIKQDNASALTIVGRYRVSLYEHDEFNQRAGGAWIQIDNSGNTPIFKKQTRPNNVGGDNLLEFIPPAQVIKNAGGILEVSTFNDSSFSISDDGTKFDNQLNSIKVEVLKAINDAQNLGGDCSFGDGFCVL